MTRLPLLVLLLTLPACTTIQPYATCDNARRAIAMAEKTAARFCPIGIVR